MDERQREMKRFSLKLGEINYNKVHEKCTCLFNLSDIDKVCIKYQDSENDWVTIKTTDDLREAIQEQMRVMNRNYICIKVQKHNTCNSVKHANLLGSFTSP